MSQGRQKNQDCQNEFSQTSNGQMDFFQSCIDKKNFLQFSKLMQDMNFFTYIYWYEVIPYRLYLNFEPHS